ncbi:MAG: MBL fold metallo-hydrolase, partial [Gemmatimonadaceae bacterium]
MAATNAPVQRATRSPDGRVDLGSSNAVGRLPRRVEIDGASWFMATSSTAASGVHLLSSTCPHQGGRIEDAGRCFECPNHGWQFKHDSGESINAPGRRMASIPVVEAGGRLFADLPLSAMAPEGPPSPRPIPRVEGLSITLHAHACLEFVYRGSSLLTDPWLDGPAFFGAWTQYPPPVVDVGALTPNAVWISHEHSDHFHERTLRHFSRNTPVYFPDFPNRRIANRLRELGFVRARAVPFGTTVELNENFRITCHEPGSLWNDSVVLIEIDGFRFLNLNDAGLNHRIARLVAPVDVLASSFSPGASGYPLTWTHLSDEQKKDIGERAKQGHLRMLREAAVLYGAGAVLPFASHFSLWHPSHERFVKALPRNTLADVVDAFADAPTPVIDLFPGDSWNGAEGDIARFVDRSDQPDDVDRQLAYLRRRFNADTFEANHPAQVVPSRHSIEEYFLRLNNTP